MKIIIIGGGGHAGVVIDAMSMNGKYDDVLGILDDFAEVGTMRHGIPVLGGISQVNDWSRKLNCSSLHIAIGDNIARANIYRAVSGSWFNFPTIIHTSAIIGLDVSIGAGSFIAAGAVVAPNSILGVCSIMNTNSSLDHDSSLGDFSSMNPGSVTGGRVSIGHRVTIGMGAMIRDGVNIANSCTIGMGAVVIKSCDENGATLYGNPARIINN